MEIKKYFVDCHFDAADEFYEFDNRFKAWHKYNELVDRYLNSPLSDWADWVSLRQGEDWVNNELVRIYTDGEEEQFAYLRPRGKHIKAA